MHYLTYRQGGNIVDEIAYQNHQFSPQHNNDQAETTRRRNKSISRVKIIPAGTDTPINSLPFSNYYNQTDGDLTTPWRPANLKVTLREGSTPSFSVTLRY